MRYGAVEHLPLPFVLVETVVEKRPEQPAALRAAKCDRALEGFGTDAKLGRAVVLELRDGIADGRETETGDRRILGFVDDLVDPVRLESAAQIHHSGVWYDALPVEPAETPLRPCDPVSLTRGRVAHGQSVRFVVRIGDRVGDMIAVGERMTRHALADDEVAAHEAADRRTAGICRPAR